MTLLSSASPAAPTPVTRTGSTLTSAQRAVLIGRRYVLIVTALPAEDVLPAEAVDVAFARKPLPVRQAVTSWLLWIVKAVCV